jgi:signal transduction histidine kinase/ligand-binding sensor domain-containing protein
VRLGAHFGLLIAPRTGVEIIRVRKAKVVNARPNPGRFQRRGVSAPAQALRLHTTRSREPQAKTPNANTGWCRNQPVCRLRYWEGISLWLLVFSLLVIARVSLGQSARGWRVYKLADGLPESACISVTSSPQGKVLVHHLTAPYISELEGYGITVLPSPETGKSRVYQSPAGQLWIAMPEGLREFRDGAWNSYSVPEIAAVPHSSSGHVIDPVPLYPVRQGLVLCLLPEKLIEFNAENPQQPRTQVIRVASQTALLGFSGMTPARDGGLWISGTRGLAKIPTPLRSLKPETEWREYVRPDSLPIQGFLAPHEDEAGGVTLVAESTTNRQKLVAYFDGQHWSAEAPRPERLRQAWRSSDHTCWAMTIDSLIQWEEGRPDLAETEEIFARQYFDVALAAGGSFWLATSDGLFRYSPLMWRTPAPVRSMASSVHCLTGDSEGRVWMVAGSRFRMLQNEQLSDYALPRLGDRPGAARACFSLKNGTLVLAMHESEADTDLLFRFQPTRGNFVPVEIPDAGLRIRALGLLKDGSLCLQNLALQGDRGFTLERYDGRQFESLPDPPPSVALGTNLNTIFAEQNGDLWLSSDRTTASYHERKWQVFASTDQTTPAGVVGFTELPDGKMWCATLDQIWEFDGRNWSVVRRGFDRVNALRATRDGSVWVASNSGVHRYHRGAWVDNGVEEGLPSASVQELLEDQRGRLWAATTRGLSQFHPDADPDPPQAALVQVSDNGNAVPEGNAVSVAFSGVDKWKYTPRERLLYSYRLDGQEWSPFMDASHRTLTDLSARKHDFQVRAMDRNCNVSEPAQMELIVTLPWYKETRLVLISIAGIGGALFFAGLAFNRHRRLVRSYAEVERKVAERTEQLEIANRELLHSQKMNALGTLAAGIAHDFNNILSIIKGSAQIIEDNLDNPDKIRVRADRIRTVVEQGAGIVKAMLGFTRESGQQSTTSSVNTIVEDTLKLMGDRFLREVSVRFEPAPELPEVKGSKDFIQQILLNFIFNATESMTSNKQIVLTTRTMPKPLPEMVLLPSAAPTYVAIDVQDYGCGISPQNLPRIFEPFFTTKDLSARRGTGLGLSMVYELAKKLEAGLAVESVADKGSTFTLVLPVLDAESPVSPEKHEPKPQPTPTA